MESFSQNSPMRCTRCDGGVNVLFMCDRDETAGEYCVACFKAMPCHDHHHEGCQTMVIGGPIAAPREPWPIRALFTALTVLLAGVVLFILLHPR